MIFPVVDPVLDEFMRERLRWGGAFRESHAHTDLDFERIATGSAFRSVFPGHGLFLIGIRTVLVSLNLIFLIVVVRVIVVEIVD